MNRAAGPGKKVTMNVIACGGCIEPEGWQPEGRR
jgi:hypothetical protein